MGLLDGSADNTDSGATGSGGLLGGSSLLPVLGAIAAYGQSPGVAPQAASRLPLAQPNIASSIGAIAGGYAQGLKAQQDYQGTNIQNQMGQLNLEGWKRYQGLFGTPPSATATNVANATGANNPALDSRSPLSTSANTNTAPSGNSAASAPSAAKSSATDDNFGAGAPWISKPWISNPNIDGGGPQSPPSPTSLLGAPTATGTGTPITPTTPPGHSAPILDSDSMGGKPPPLFGVASIMRQLSVLQSFPGGAGLASRYLGMLPKVPENSYLATDGSVQSLPNAENVIAQQNFAKGYGESQGTYPAQSALQTNKPQVLRGPGATLVQNGRVIAQVPVGINGVNNDPSSPNYGAPTQNYSFLGVNPNGARNALAGASGPAPRTNLLGTPGPAPGPAVSPPRTSLLGGPVPNVAPSTGNAAPAVAPQAAAPSQASPAPGVSVNAQGLPGVQSDLSPLQKKSQEEHADELESQGKAIDEAGSNAVAANFSFDQMRAESQSWDPGKFADWKGDAKAYLQQIFPDHDWSSLGDYQAFQKNSVDLLRQVTRATSSRAAYQEMSLLAGSLPRAEMSPQGLGQVIDQYQASNDFLIAKQQGAQQWRQSHGQTLNGFEPYWNSNVTPGVFLVHRLSPQGLQAMRDNLSKTPEGQAAIKTLAARVGWAQQNGLFDGLDGTQ